MTGYGVAQARNSDSYIEVIVQSFNNKYLDVRYQFPPIYNSMRKECKRLLNAIFNRGYIEVLVIRNPLWPQQEMKVGWNRDQAVKWKRIYEDMAKKLNLKNNLDLMSLSAKTGVLQTVSMPSFLSDQERKVFQKLLLKAAHMCDKERRREGQFLKKDFQKNLEELTSCLKYIRVFDEEKNKQTKISLKKKLRKKGNNHQKVLDETAESLMRQDIGEELSRLKEHIRVFRSLFSLAAPVGKKMSFYLQEMVREINTVGSKSQYFQLINQVVQAKSLIEKMREQVQNVE